MNRRQYRIPGFRGSSHRAFTLLELLIAIVIIAILLGLLLPTIAHVRHAVMRLGGGS